MWDDGEAEAVIGSLSSRGLLEGCWVSLMMLPLLQMFRNLPRICDYMF